MNFDEEMITRVKWMLQNPPGWNTKTERWVVVKKLFGVGSTTAVQICQWAGVNPWMKKTNERSK